MLSPNGFFIDELPNRLPQFSLETHDFPTDLVTEDGYKKSQISITGSGILYEIVLFNSNVSSNLLTNHAPNRLVITIDDKETILFSKARTESYTEILPYGYMTRDNLFYNIFAFPLRFYKSLEVSLEYNSNVTITVFSTTQSNVIKYGIEQ